jgi:hypothetical protein
MKQWKSLKVMADKNRILSIRHISGVTQSKIFKELKQIVSTRKDHIDFIYEKRSSRLIAEEFKRMIYIMRK